MCCVGGRESFDACAGVEITGNEEVGGDSEKEKLRRSFYVELCVCAYRPDLSSNDPNLRAPMLSASSISVVWNGLSSREDIVGLKDYSSGQRRTRLLSALVITNHLRIYLWVLMGPPKQPS